MPTDVWSKLESSLGHAKGKKPVAWWWAAGAAAALLLGVGVYKTIGSIETGAKQNDTASINNEFKGESQNHKTNETTNTKANAGTSITEDPFAVEKHSDYNNGVIDNNPNASGVIVLPIKTNNSSRKNNAFNVGANKVLSQDQANLATINSNDPVIGEFESGLHLDPLVDLKLGKSIVLDPAEFSEILDLNPAGIYDENAFPAVKNLTKGNTPGLSSYIYGVSIGQMRNNLSFSAKSNVYVHRDFESVQKGNLEAVNSLDFEGFIGKRLSNNGWFATAGIRAGQQASTSKYNFLRTPAERDETLESDNFNNYPIVGYLDFFSAQVQYQTSQKSFAVDMPIGVLKQTKLGEKWLLNTGLTVNPSVLVSSQGQTLSYSDLTPLNVESNWYRKVMIGSAATVGISRKISSGSLGLQLKGRAYPFNVYKVGSSVSQRPYDFGVSLQWIGGLTK